jgi:hypothetical protein
VLVAMSQIQGRASRAFRKHEASWPPRARTTMSRSRKKMLRSGGSMQTDLYDFLPALPHEGPPHAVND